MIPNFFHNALSILTHLESVAVFEILPKSLAYREKARENQGLPPDRWQFPHSGNRLDFVTEYYKKDGITLWQLDGLRWAGYSRAVYPIG